MCVFSGEQPDLWEASRYNTSPRSLWSIFCGSVPTALSVASLLSLFNAPGASLIQF
uniref:Uncharacterized protein n=1 Tax=Anguilla anguilla TaxID=7936 RepID=A0A0E9TN34_ANGAN